MKHIKNNKGFTLIEILVAMSIISIITFTFFTIMNSSIKQNSKNEKDIKALNIAQSEIENLRKEIKSSATEINIYDKEGNILIEIPDDDEIVWQEIDSTNKIDIINIKDDGIYNKYIGKDDDGTEILQYIRNVDGDSSNYIVKLKLSRQKKASKYLYTVEVKVKAENSLSKKETVMNTSILSK